MFVFFNNTITKSQESLGPTFRLPNTSITGQSSSAHYPAQLASTHRSATKGSQPYSSGGPRETGTQPRFTHAGAQ